MKHITELELIEFAAGSIAGPLNVVIEEHLSQCDQCRQMYEQTRLVYDSLGDLDAPQVSDLTARIRRHITTRKHRWNWFAARVAAVILISALAGFLAALKLTPAQTDFSIVKTQTDISFAQPARHIALAASGEIK